MPEKSPVKIVCWDAFLYKDSLVLKVFKEKYDKITKKKRFLRKLQKISEDSMKISENSRIILMGQWLLLTAIKRNSFIFKKKIFTKKAVTEIWFAWKLCGHNRTKCLFHAPSPWCKNWLQCSQSVANSYLPTTYRHATAAFSLAIVRVPRFREQNYVFIRKLIRCNVM